QPFGIHIPVGEPQTVLRIFWCGHRRRISGRYRCRNPGWRPSGASFFAAAASPPAFRFQENGLERPAYRHRADPDSVYVPNAGPSAEACGAAPRFTGAGCRAGRRRSRFSGCRLCHHRIRAARQYSRPYNHHRGAPAGDLIMITEISAQLAAHREVITLIERQLSPLIAEFVTLLEDTFNRGGKILVMGNGGSAADAQHFAAEIVGRFKMERRGLPALALSTDTSILTAVGNDYGFDRIFSRQVEALAAPCDLIVGISTSGNSPNVLQALELARDKGCRTVGLLGKDGGSIKGACDLALIVPTADTPRVQEGHITIIHIVCDLLEKAMFS